MGHRTRISRAESTALNHYPKLALSSQEMGERNWAPAPASSSPETAEQQGRLRERRAPPEKAH